MRTCEFCKHLHFVPPYWQCEKCGAVLPDNDDAPRPQADEEISYEGEDDEEEDNAQREA